MTDRIDTSGRSATLTAAMERAQAAALEQGIIKPVSTQHTPWKPPEIESKAAIELAASGRSLALQPVEDDLNDTGRATSRQQYRDSISFSRRVPSTPNTTRWYELSRFIVRRGEIGVIRLLWTWLDLIGSPWAPGFTNPTFFVRTFANVNLKSLFGYSIGLPGLPTQFYTPLFLVGRVTAETGALAGDVQIRLGTTAGGNEIMSDRVLVGFDGPGAQYTINLAGLIPPINAAATLFLTVTGIDSGVATGTADFDIYGSIVSQGVVVPFASGSPCGIDPIGHLRQGVQAEWSLRFEQLAGRPMSWSVPVVHSGSAMSWPGVPWVNMPPWPDARYAWGTPAGQVCLVVPEDTIARLGLAIADNDAIAYMGYCGARLQGYVQAAHSRAAVKSVREAWQW